MTTIPIDQQIRILLYIGAFMGGSIVLIAGLTYLLKDVYLALMCFLGVALISISILLKLIMG